VRSVKYLTRHPLLYLVAFIPILHDPHLFGSCVPPGSYGEAMFDEALFDEAPFRPDLSLQPIRDSLSLPSIPVDVIPWTLLVSTHWSPYQLWSTRGTTFHRWYGSEVKGRFYYNCIALLSPFIFGGPPVAQMPLQLSPPGVLTITVISRRASSERLSEGSLLRVLEHPVS